MSELIQLRDRKAPVVALRRPLRRTYFEGLVHGAVALGLVLLLALGLLGCEKRQAAGPPFTVEPQLSPMVEWSVTDHARNQWLRAPLRDFVIQGEDGRKITILRSGPHGGNVTLPPDMDISEASRMFWRVLGETYADVCEVRQGAQPTPTKVLP